jgi:hypothetical protein
MATAQVVLAGNHELFVLERVWTQLRAGWALYAQLAYHELGPERLERLATLQPHESIPALGVELAHGSLTDHWSGFVEETPDAYLTLQKATQPLVLVGHTHTAAYFREPMAGALPESQRITFEHEYALDRPSVLNPGAGHDERQAHWLELRLEGNRRSAIWHRSEIDAHPSPAKGG